MQGDTVTSAEDRAWGLSSGLKGCDTVEKVAEVAPVTSKDVKGMPKLIKWYGFSLNLGLLLSFYRFPIFETSATALCGTTGKPH